MSKFYIGTSPKDAYMLPSGANVMVNARQYWRGDRFVSSRPRNVGELWLDCGGFVFFNDLGEFPFSHTQYLTLVEKLKPSYFATMDYPCEPSITGGMYGSINDRIHRTVNNAIEILDDTCMLNCGAKPVPVIQGWELEDYIYCMELYAANGAIREYMAVGSMCSRSNSDQIVNLWRGIYDYARSVGAKRLHAFGLKLSTRLQGIDEIIYSRDSAVVYMPSGSSLLRKSWQSTGENPQRFAVGREQKKNCVNLFVNNIERRGLLWRSA